MDSETARTVAGLLESVVKGKIEPQSAIAQWPKMTAGELLVEAAWHDLTHFAADDDIREKDARYAKYQISDLMQRIEEIRAKYHLR